jgi:branched-chain amino acid transport system substrate-binding protein
VTDFSSQIRAAQAAGAQVLTTVLPPPDAVTLWKQMKALGYQPLVAFANEGADTAAWPHFLGHLTEGTMATDWWSPSLGYPEAQRFVTRDAPLVGGQTVDLTVAVTSNSVVRVLFDAISRAGSTDPDAVNTALSGTNKIFPVGPIKFSAQHFAVLQTTVDQWQGGKMVKVFPAGLSAVQIEAPPPGLQ